MIVQIHELTATILYVATFSLSKYWTSYSINFQKHLLFIHNLFWLGLWFQDVFPQHTTVRCFSDDLCPGRLIENKSKGSCKKSSQYNPLTCTVNLVWLVAFFWAQFPLLYKWYKLHYGIPPNYNFSNTLS